MSTLGQVDRFAVAQEQDRFAVAQEKDRFAVANEKVRSTVAPENNRVAPAPQPPRPATSLARDRSSLCTFTFSDGRRCRAPLSVSGHPSLCRFHAKKDAQARAAEDLSRDVSYFFSGTYLSACDLSAALGRLFAAVAAGNVKPKTAATLAYLGQTLIQTIHMAQNEYIRAFGESEWQATLRKSVNENYNFRQPKPQEPSEEEPDELVEQTQDEISEQVQVQQESQLRLQQDSSTESPKSAAHNSANRPTRRTSRHSQSEAHSHSPQTSPTLPQPSPNSSQPAASPSFSPPS